MPMEIYYFEASAPCRKVLLAVKALGLSPKFKRLNILEGEQLGEEFLSLNPLHCVPTLVDDDMVLWESIAIVKYLALKYGTDSGLYPTDIAEQAVVDKMLLFDLGTLWKRFTDVVFPVLFHESDSFDEDRLTSLKEGLEWLDGFLSESPYVAGDGMTVADLCLLATLTTITATGVQVGHHESLCGWLHRMENEVEGFQQNSEGAAMFGAFVKSRLASNDTADTAEGTIEGDTVD